MPLPWIHRSAAFMVLTSFLAASGCGRPSSSEEEPARVTLTLDEPSRKVDVSIDGSFFSSYIFADTTGMLQRPILYPIVTESGTEVTRGFPLNPRPGERADHPHQVGSWMNHGDVNDLDFWNNSGERAAEDAWRYGTIRHKAIERMESGNPGILVVSAEWIRSDGSVVLDELTTFTFAADSGVRRIDRVTTWAARTDTVVFEDSKEGMMAIRVARALEQPTDRLDPFVLDDGSLSEPRLDSSYATGRYLNSEGLEGDAVWGKRATWVVLNGSIDDEPVAVAMFDHPGNPDHPSHWMARGYGLFAVNPLGARVYSDGAESLDLTLEPGASVTFRYRLLVHAGSRIDGAWMRARYDVFTDSNLPVDAD